MDSPRRGTNRWSVSGAVSRGASRWAWPPPPNQNQGPAVTYGGSLSALNSLDYQDRDPLSEFGLPQTEAELALHYQQKITDNQQKYLEPLREDLADWLNKTLALDYVTSENLLEMLDNGVLLCHLASLIQSKAKSLLDDSNRHEENDATLLTVAKKVPVSKIRCWERAAKRSFFSRENASNFLKFCREIGIHENLLFESEDLVNHARPRNVILCLLEVGRFAVGLEIEPPTLVQLERDVDLQIEQYQCGLETDTGLPSSLNGSFNESNAQMNRSMTFLKIEDEVASNIATPVEENVHVIIQTQDGKQKTTELDKKVEQLALATRAECCCIEKCCAKLVIYKLSEGLYRIGDRNVFIRLFKDRHVMVRVGGGWDTLEHYLIRHDPCRKADRYSRCNTPDIGSMKASQTSNGSLSTKPTVLANSAPCLNESKPEHGAHNEPRKPARIVNPQRRFVTRSLTLELNQDPRAHPSPSPSNAPKRTTSFTVKSKQLNSEITGADSGFRRFSAERSSLSSAVRYNRPASAIYNRTKATDTGSTPNRAGRN